MRTRSEILDIIRGGETININGVDYNSHNVHKLPSEAELALGNEDKEVEAEVSIKAQIARLEGDLKKLEASKAARAKKEESADEAKNQPKGGVITGDKTSEPKPEVKPEAKTETKPEAKSDAKK